MESHKIFDPNGAAVPNSGIFGFHFKEDDSKLIILPIAWEATCSYGNGASESPDYIFAASKFVELYDEYLKDFYNEGIFYASFNNNINKLSKKSSALSKKIIELAGSINDNKLLLKKKDEVNQNCKEMLRFVYENCSKYLKKGKVIGLIGGDHSISQGAIEACMEKYPDMGVLQIDAHCDLRKNFENLKYSHASVMYNTIEELGLKKLVQVGVRGYCEEESNRIKNSNGKIVTFFDAELNSSASDGISWTEKCKEIIQELPEHVYVSFDIDGLEQQNCPNSGTPMPGGITYNQSLHLIKLIFESGRKIIGFDLVEVACGKEGSESWDAVLAANLLYKLCGFTIISNRKK